MKRRILCLVNCCIFLFVICGCNSNKENDPANSTFGIIFYEGAWPSPGASIEEIQGQQTSVMACHWNVAAGELIFEDAPAFSFYGSTPFILSQWDGDHSITVPSGLEVFDLNSEYSLTYGIPEPGILCGEGYYCAIDDETTTLTLDSGDVYTFTNTEGPLMEDGPAALNRSSRLNNLLAFAYANGVLTIVFFYSNGGSGQLVFVKLDTADSSVSWSDPIEVPPECIGGLLRFFAEPSQAAIVDNKLYYTGSTALGCLDLSTGESFPLTDISAKLDGLFSEGHRADTYGLLTQVAGYNAGMVVGYTDYRSDDGNVSYSVLYAIQDDQLLGGLYITQPLDGSGEIVSITTFDDQLEALHSLTPDMIGFQYMKGLFAERHHYA